MEFKENVLFELLKETAIVNNKIFKAELMEKHNLDDHSASRLIVQIRNYQMNKYGYGLDDGQKIVRDDFELIRKRANTRKQCRNRLYGIKTINSKENRWRE